FLVVQENLSQSQTGDAILGVDVQGAAIVGFRQIMVLALGADPRPAAQGVRVVGLQNQHPIQADQGLFEAVGLGEPLTERFQDEVFVGVRVGQVPGTQGVQFGRIDAFLDENKATFQFNGVRRTAQALAKVQVLRSVCVVVSAAVELGQE